MEAHERKARISIRFAERHGGTPMQEAVEQFEGWIESNSWGYVNAPKYVADYFAAILILGAGYRRDDGITLSEIGGEA